MRWIYEHTPDDAARFVLGVAGEHPLVCVGVNPSTASPERLDTTVTRVVQFAARNGFDSWVMLNIYPQRSTDPNGMHAVYRVDWATENVRRIAQLVGGRPHTMLAAWGGLVERRPYLPELLADIATATDAAGCRWVSIGDLTKRGHPRHPSRARYDSPLVPFDLAAYCQRHPPARPSAAPGRRPR